MSMFLRGLIIGFSIAAPVGPIGVLCIRRTLVEGRLSGLVSGLGAACADAIYGLIAAFGITYISNFLIDQQTWFSLIGGLFLCALGIRSFRLIPGDQVVENSSKSKVENFFSIFFLTLTNPLTILSFAAIFAGMGLSEGGGDYQTSALMVLGVFTGSALWWLTLSQGVGVFRDRITPQWMLWINRISGLVVFTFGILAVIKAFFLISPL